jgi:ABC-type proline/glycine betaine transport system ATPase subunit
MQIQQSLNTTIVLITHDVDEAVLLSDRVLMMTNGPAATVGEILDVNLPRPRNGCNWLMTAVITTCASRSSISSMKNSRKRPEVSEMTLRLLIIGNGMAATRLVEKLSESAADRYAITMIGDEPGHAYNRIQLSPVLGAEKAFSDTVLHDAVV